MCYCPDGAGGRGGDRRPAFLLSLGFGDGVHGLFFFSNWRSPREQIGGDVSGGEGPKALKTVSW